MSTYQEDNEQENEEKCAEEFKNFWDSAQYELNDYTDAKIAFYAGWVAKRRNIWISDT